MPDLIYLLDHLVDRDGKILIPGIHDDVVPLDPAEDALYKGINFDLKAYRTEAGVHQLRCPESEVRADATPTSKMHKRR
jgi:nonspecific dipeptidase